MENCRCEGEKNLTPFQKFYLSLNPIVKGYISLCYAAQTKGLEEESRLRISEEQIQQLDVISKDPELQAELIQFGDFISKLSIKQE